jgi:hypothetical protein
MNIPWEKIIIPENRVETPDEVKKITGRKLATYAYGYRLYMDCGYWDTRANRVYGAMHKASLDELRGHKYGDTLVLSVPKDVFEAIPKAIRPAAKSQAARPAARPR